MQQTIAATKDKAAEGFSGFALKYIAVILMLLDHIHYFFEYTGKVPLFFSWLGRLAAPLFLFCIIEGFIHTSDRRKYFLRIYSLAILMGLIQFSFYNIAYGLVRPDGFFPQNQMLASFSILLVVLQGIDWCTHKKWGRGLCAILIPLLLPYGAGLIMSLFPATGFVINLLAYSVLPLHAFIADGGTAVLLSGILLYVFRNHRRVQAAAFVAFCVLWDILRIWAAVPGIHMADFFTQCYEWMEIFAVIPMLCYNGKRGHGSKGFFYWFYPVHIYILYGLSCILYHTFMS